MGLDDRAARRQPYAHRSVFGREEGVEDTVHLVGHGQLVALATRKAIDELRLGSGDRVFALIKTVALDEPTVVALQS